MHQQQIQEGQRESLLSVEHSCTPAVGHFGTSAWEPSCTGGLVLRSLVSRTLVWQPEYWKFGSKHQGFGVFESKKQGLPCQTFELELT